MLLEDGEPKLDEELAGTQTVSCCRTEMIADRHTSVLFLAGAVAAALALVGCAQHVAPELVSPPESSAVTSGGLNDSATYLARVDGGVILFDLGWWGAPAALDEGLEQMGATADDVVAVFLTHAHRDHVGGWKSVRQAPFYLAQEELDLFLGREQPGGWIPRTAARLRERDLPDPGEVVTVPFDADTAFVFSADTVHAFLVPGHTAGSAAYLFRGTLFAGDAVSRTWTGRFRAARGGYSDDVEQSRQSLASLRHRLRPHRVDRVCTAHLKCAPATDDFWDAVLEK